MKTRLTCLAILTLTTLAFCAPSAGAHPRPRTGTYGQYAGEGSSIQFSVRDGRVRDLRVMMNVACIQDGGVPYELGVNPNFTFETPTRARISPRNRATVAFVGGTDELSFNVHVRIAWLGRRHARAYIYADAIPENSACVGESRFGNIYLEY